jgi:hypothetical protein
LQGREAKLGRAPAEQLVSYIGARAPVSHTYKLYSFSTFVHHHSFTVITYANISGVNAITITSAITSNSFSIHTPAPPLLLHVSSSAWGLSERPFLLIVTPVDGGDGYGAQDSHASIKQECRAPLSSNNHLSQDIRHRTCTHP